MLPSAGFFKNSAYSVVNAFYRALLFMQGGKYGHFDKDIYKGKRVIVIGPASSSLSYLKGEQIDQFDIVVRVNKSPATLSGYEKKLGSKTDVLYHCCDEDPVTGGGKIDEKLLSSQGLKYVIYTYGEKALLRNFFKCVLKYPRVKFLKTDDAIYKNLCAVYRGVMPTTGLQALNHVLKCDFGELHITGFTFFQTAYANGYRDEYKSAEAAYNLAKSRGNHDPDEELRVFVEVYKEALKKGKVFIDKELISIIDKI